MTDPLPAPRTAEGGLALARLVAAPERALLATDYDGCLAPIVARPEDARPAAGAVDALRRLAGVLRGVAVVTGRGAEEVVRLGGLDVVPGLRVSGHYGLQRWAGGRLETPPQHPGVERLRGPLARLAADAPSGTEVEDKGHSLAVHTRRTADPAGVLDALRPRLDELAGEAGLQVTPGRYVVELRPPGVDKGAALRTLVAETGAAVLAYSGDDVGDLPALEAVRELRDDPSAGVAGLVVCADSPESPAALRDRADLVVDGPTGLVQLLSDLAAELGA